MTFLGNVIIDSRDVDIALGKLMLLMSDAGMSAFLSSSVGPYLKERAEARFANEGDDVTGPWAALRPATVLIRESLPYAIGGEHPINRRTGELENWVVQGGWHAYPTGVGATLRYPRNSPSGELRKKVSTAQKGDKASNTVARPVLGVNEKDLLFVMTALAFAVEKAIK